MEEINRKLNFLLANLQVQRANLQAAHWNLRGCHSFIPIHKYLGELYEANSEHIDMVAELIRIHDGTPFTTFSRYLRRATIQEIVEAEMMEADAVLKKAYNDNTFVLSGAKEIFKETGEMADVNDYMALMVADYGKRQWFIKSSISKPMGMAQEATTPVKEEEEVVED